MEIGTEHGTIGHPSIGEKGGGVRLLYPLACVFVHTLITMDKNSTLWAGIITLNCFAADEGIYNCSSGPHGLFLY